MKRFYLPTGILFFSTILQAAPAIWMETENKVSGQMMSFMKMNSTTSSIFLSDRSTTMPKPKKKGFFGVLNKTYRNALAETASVVLTLNIETSDGSIHIE